MLPTDATTVHAAPRLRLGRRTIVAGVVLAVLLAMRAALGVTWGLRAEYVADGSLSRSPDISEVDPQISTSEINRSWIGAPPEEFAVRWRGYVVVGHGDFYTFLATSRPRTRITVDGLRILDKESTYEPITGKGRIHLAQGAHPILVELLGANGTASLLDLGWAHDRVPAVRPLPTWALVTKPTSYWKTVAARTLDWLVVVAVAVAGVALLRFLWIYQRQQIRAAIERRPRLTVFILFVGLAAFETWPLAAHPARLSRDDNADTMLGEWIIAWVTHQAVSDPLHLFDANIFHPERNTLAYGESMIVQSALAAPVLVLGGTPALAYNVVLLAGFALSGWAMSLVVARWTGDWVAGVAAGAAYAFNAHLLARLPHLQAQHVEFLPVMLLVLDALLRNPRARHAIWLGLAFTLQSLTSGHLMVFGTTALVAATLSRPEDWLSARGPRVALTLTIAAALSAVLLVPFLLPYWQNYHQGMFRPLEYAPPGTTWRDYLSTPGRLHFDLWSHHFYTGNALFPGFTALAFAALALARGVAWRDRRARMCLAFGIAGFLLSFGAALPGYATLYETLPILKGIRVVARFGYLAVVAVAVLAGFGFAEFRRRAPVKSKQLVSAAAFALIIVEPLAIPKRYVRVEPISSVYAKLAREREAIVAELPMYASGAMFRNARYMVNSTVHWKPLFNGYSGFVPASYGAHLKSAAMFPAPSSLSMLRQAGVTHVVVHQKEIGALALAAIVRSPELQLMANDGAIALYRLGHSR